MPINVKSVLKQQLKLKFGYVIGVFLVCSVCYAEIDPKTAEICIMGEARGEPYAGQVAVAEVLRRRGSTNGFYGCKAKFSPTSRESSRAKNAWEESQKSNYSHGATHFESTDFKTPYWAGDMTVVARIGKHKFYRKIS